jgi:hypothetical protein
VIVNNDEHSKKHHPPSDITEFGIVSDSNDEHSEKQWNPSDST